MSNVKVLPPPRNPALRQAASIKAMLDKPRIIRLRNVAKRPVPNTDKLRVLHIPGGS
jgi:hypothetical protein